METPDLDRLTILERAQQLYDATMRRHGDMLDRHEDSRLQHEAALARHETAMAELRSIQERQERLMETLATMLGHQADRLTTLETTQERQERLMETLAEIQRDMRQTQDAILDLLRRFNGRP